MEPIDGCFLCVRVLDTEGVFLILETVGRDGGLLNELPGADRAAELDVGVDSVENLGATGLVNGFLRVSVSMVASWVVNLNRSSSLLGFRLGVEPHVARGTRQGVQ